MHGGIRVGRIEQLPSGSYRVSVYSGTDPLTGSELRHRETARARHQAQILLGRLLEQADAGRRPDSRVLVRELLTQYLDVAQVDPRLLRGMHPADYPAGSGLGRSAQGPGSDAAHPVRATTALRQSTLRKWQAGC
jgi:hypothetical protein